MKINIKEVNPLIIDPKELAKKAVKQEVVIWEVYCNKCGELIYEGLVNFDMEDVDEYDQCPKCEHQVTDLWEWIITIKGTGIYVINGLFSNDNMTEFRPEEACAMLLFQKNGHGASKNPKYAYNVKELLEFDGERKPDWFHPHL